MLFLPESTDRQNKLKEETASDPQFIQLTKIIQRMWLEAKRNLFLNILYFGTSGQHQEPYKDS